jgi:hypothetical protein
MAEREEQVKETTTVDGDGTVEQTTTATETTKVEPGDVRTDAQDRAINASDQGASQDGAATS